MDYSGDRVLPRDFTLIQLIFMHKQWASDFCFHKSLSLTKTATNSLHGVISAVTLVSDGPSMMVAVVLEDLGSYLNI